VPISGALSHAALRVTGPRFPLPKKVVALLIVTGTATPTASTPQSGTSVPRA